MKLHLSVLSYLLAPILLAACGGGGSGTPTTPVAIQPVAASIIVSNAVPNANAGVDQTLSVGSVAMFDGGASSDANGDTLSYHWTLTAKPAGSTATLSTTSGARPQITLDVPGIFTGVLSVNDGKSESATDSVSITATAPVASVMPLAKAGANQNVFVGATVTLDGTTSTAQNTKSLTYRWIFVSKPSGSALLSSATAAKPSFIADVAGTYTLGLVVNNSTADSAMATVVITASPPATTANTAPVANAGMDQLVTTGATVSLDGTLSKDANGDRLNYTWTLLTKPAQSTAVLTSSFLGTTGFRADLSGVYEVRLSVNDGKVDSTASDLISIVAAAANAFVIADTGTYRCSALSRDQALALYAAGHTYLDRDHDGKPCEANDLLNEAASPYVAPAPSSGGQCWVNGYTRKNGTHVNGYFRRC